LKLNDSDLLDAYNKCIYAYLKTMGEEMIKFISWL
jgi:hypothetical protein